MDQIYNNSPSSNSWIKFEETDEVLVTKESRRRQTVNQIDGVLLPTAPASHLPLPSSFEGKGSFEPSGENRYSAFDSLRFGSHKESDLGWSSYLLNSQQ